MSNELPLDLKEKMVRFSTPLDVERYVEAGHISRTTPSSKTKFFLHDVPDNLPKELTERIQAVEIKSQKGGTSKTVVTLNLKILKL